MQLDPREIIVLKPTASFLSFLASQAPDIILPTLKLLQTDITAYTFPLHASDDALLETIEANFELMFQYEIKRWLGDETYEHFKGSFLDFLCCFKFEIHDHIIVLEPSFESGQQLLRVKPRSFFLKKMESQLNSTHHFLEDDDILSLVETVTLSHLTENATVIIKNFNALKEVHPFLKQYFRPIFKMEMMRVCEARSQWPKVDSFEDFSRYFLVDVHTHVVHL